MRCPVCGARENEKPFIGPFCVDCYEVKCKLPKELELLVCARCGKARLRGEWREISEGEVEEWVLSKCKGEDQPVAFDLENREVIFKLYGKEVRKPIKLIIKRITCPTCAKMSGGYYEAILQLRGDWSKIREWAKKFKRALSLKTFISKEEELKEGIDLYVGESKKLLEVLQSFGLKWKCSWKLHGVKDGKRVYRATYVVRWSDDEDRGR